MNNNRYSNDVVEISIPELFRMVMSRIGMIILLTVISFAVAVLYIKYTTPIYTASTTILINPLKSSGDINDLVYERNTNNSQRIDTEISMITSSAA